LVLPFPTPPCIDELQFQQMSLYNLDVSL